MLRVSTLPLRRIQSLHHSLISRAASTLYQYTICPYCNKAKALMEYSGFQYDRVEVNPLTKAELKWSTDYRKVPILTIDDQVYKGSDVIIDRILEEKALHQKLTDNQMDLETFKSGQEWVTFANDELAALLYPNICRTLGDSYKAFSYVHGVESFSPVQRTMIQGIGSLAMYFAASKVKKKRNITDERKALEEALTKLETEGLGDKKFLSGKESPNLGDIVVYGTLKAIEGFPAHDEFVYQRGGVLLDWYERMSRTMKH